MKRALFALVLLSVFLTACGQGSLIKDNREPLVQNQNVQVNERSIETRFSPPPSYHRVSNDGNAFSSYLRKLPLKPKGSEVSYFNGKIKPNRNVYDAVVDLPIGKRDLHQCADAVMRLRAEYLFEQTKYDSIHFNFTNGFVADYSNWRKGNRIVVQGNDVCWKARAQPSTSYKDFWKYLEMVFSYAGTASLEKELKSIRVEEMKIGDVFIKGGLPGHAVIVVDMAENERGEKVFLLAQSYMPAQEIQILKNPNDHTLSPWYSAEISNELRTPEWVFKRKELRRFVD